MGEAGDVADAKALSSALAKGGGQHQGWGNPGQTRDANLGEGSGQEESRENCQRITAVN